MKYTQELDPTRLVDCASGWNDENCGDVHDVHSYPGPAMAPPEEHRASVLGEYGGLGLPVDGHKWNEQGNWGYVSFKDNDELFKKYDELNKGLQPMIGQGLSAAVYTQTTDVETESNGLMTYDRQVIKMSVEENGRFEQVAVPLSVKRPFARVWVRNADNSRVGSARLCLLILPYWRTQHWNGYNPG